LSGSSGAGNNGTIRANPIPDFRAIHAHLDASQAHRKENIHPVIPQPFHWATDERIKERQEFDEVVKEKEREREILLEQIRKEKAEDEEMEIRELRKRAVPKANAVPDWYKDAPKKKKDEETIAG
jgi:myo-inositol catabolism protein IolC